MKFRISLVALGFLTLVGPQANSTEFRVLASWDDSHPARRTLLTTYLKNVEVASKGDLSFKLSGPETVPPFEQLQPVSAGIFQMLFTHPGYHTGSTTFLIPIDGLKGDSKTAREAGLYDLIDKHYQRFGMKLIFMTKSIESSGYQIILRQPVGASGDLAGRKIRGTQNYGGVFSLLHASPVVMPPGEVYSALEKGVVDGAAWPAVGVLDYKWNEVAKFLMRPLFGSSPYYLFVNLNSWNNLSKAQQTVLLEQGKKIQGFWDPEWLRLSKVEQEKLIAAGSQVTEVNPKVGAQLNSAWASGLWTLAATKANAKDLDELRAFAKTHGLE
ncbi:MAG TPA: TRAP transporter substrate-binding protein DctP [Bryobacteraceae bacterium]|nr:TRAP transporter substrate-binding protein DctP [Bryobacteraceae bacterium]